MNPGIFTILKAAPNVTALLGTDELRVYPYNKAPDKVSKPYATYGVIAGIPQNYLADRADMDEMTSQIDIWADSSASCNACFDAIREALEAQGYVTNFAMAERDPATTLYNARMDFDNKVSR